ncbi:MAG: hypothetical protein WBZ36_07705 [Candidatus Nitrosopolaris sp.]
MNKKIERLITAGMITALIAIFFYQVVYGLNIKSVAKHAFYFRNHEGREDGLYRNTDFGNQCYTEDPSHFSHGLQWYLEQQDTMSN